MNLPGPILDRLADLADLIYPYEACGTLVGTAERVVDAYWAPNLHGSCERFEVDPQAIVDADRSARRRGLRLVGFWHSHPDAPAEPSSADRAGAWSGYAQVLVAVDALGRTESRLVDLGR